MEEQSEQQEAQPKEQQKKERQNPYVIPLAIVLAGVLIAGAIFFRQPTEPIQGNTETQSGEVSVELEGWASLGDPDAPVVMVEYADFACPFCTRFSQETLPLIKRDYIDEGKVFYVYKDFISVGGDRAAEAAHCAGEQDKYWEYHDLLFERSSEDRQQWSDSQVHEGYAQELGLDSGALVGCFEDRRFQDKVSESHNEARQNAARGTPYFLVNNRPVSGAQPYSTFQRIINSALEE